MSLYTQLECYCSPLLTHTFLHSPCDDIIVFLVSTYIGISLNLIRQSCTQLPWQMSGYLSWLRHTKHAHHWANSLQSYHIRLYVRDSPPPVQSSWKRWEFTDFSMWKQVCPCPHFGQGTLTFFRAKVKLVWTLVIMSTDSSSDSTWWDARLNNDNCSY